MGRNEAQMKGRREGQGKEERWLQMEREHEGLAAGRQMSEERSEVVKGGAAAMREEKTRDRDGKRGHKKNNDLSLPSLTQITLHSSDSVMWQQEGVKEASGRTSRSTTSPSTTI